MVARHVKAQRPAAAEALRLTAAGRPGLVTGPTDRPLAPSPERCYDHLGLPS